jgi:acetoin utilization protein AcuB
MALPISHYMVRTLFVLASEDSASSARALMAQHELHYLPVVDEEQLVGVVSDFALAKLTAADARVVDALTADVTEVVSTIPLTDVLALMQEHQLSSVVVTGETGIEGVFTITDAMREFGHLLEHARH